MGHIYGMLNYVTIKNMLKNKMIHQNNYQEWGEGQHMSFIIAIKEPTNKTTFSKYEGLYSQPVNGIYKAFLYFFSPSFPEVICCTVLLIQGLQRLQLSVSWYIDFVLNFQISLSNSFGFIMIPV